MHVWYSYVCFSLIDGRGIIVAEDTERVREPAATPAAAAAAITSEDVANSTDANSTVADVNTSVDQQLVSSDKICNLNSDKVCNLTATVVDYCWYIRRPDHALHQSCRHMSLMCQQGPHSAQPGTGLHHSQTPILHLASSEQ